MFYSISMQMCVHDVLLLVFLVLRVMILYHIMIPLPPLSSLIVLPHQLFANMAYMIVPMILPLSVV
jgi:hypothetical protein